MYYVYVLRSQKDKKTYTGYTSNLEERLKRHNSGKVRSTRYRVPLDLLFSEEFIDRSEAKRRELWWKSKTGRQALHAYFEKMNLNKDVILQVGVKILLKNKEGKYLLIRRSLEKYPEAKGRWDIVGGRIEAGTSLLENLKREIKEETNLDLVGDPTLITAQDILKNPGKHIVRLTYIGEGQGEIKLDTIENDLHEWYTLEQLKNLDDVDVYFKELISKNLI